MSDAPKPPIISFIKKPVEDREQSIKAGFRVCKDVDYIELIPHGSGGKQKMEYVFAEWAERIKREVETGDEYNPSRFPREWFDKIMVAHKAWNAGDEIPVDGTLVKLWPVASPAEMRNCDGAGYVTVEQLAEANEEGVMRLGMGGRALVERAKAWVAVKNDPAAKTSANLAKLEQENKDLRSTVANQAEKLAILLDRVDKLDALKAA